MNQNLNNKTKHELIAECERLMAENTRHTASLSDEAIWDMAEDLLKPGTIWATINNNQLLINKEQALVFARAVLAASAGKVE